MSRKGPRQVFFVCVSLSQEKELITKIISSDTPAEASKIFNEQYSILPKEILGPFFKKRAQIIENTRELKFTNQNKKAIYDGWLVNSFLLKEPINQAYIVFIKRMDDLKIPFPKGTIIVPVSELKFI